MHSEQDVINRAILITFVCDGRAEGHMRRPGAEMPALLASVLIQSAHGKGKDVGSRGEGQMKRPLFEGTNLPVQCPVAFGKNDNGGAGSEDPGRPVQGPDSLGTVFTGDRDIPPFPGQVPPQGYGKVVIRLDAHRVHGEGRGDGEDIEHAFMIAHDQIASAGLKTVAPMNPKAQTHAQELYPAKDVDCRVYGPAVGYDKAERYNEKKEAKADPPRAPQEGRTDRFHARVPISPKAGYPDAETVFCAQGGTAVLAPPAQYRKNHLSRYLQQDRPAQGMRVSLPRPPSRSRP